MPERNVIKIGMRDSLKLNLSLTPVADPSSSLYSCGG
jgi:hypothetical protein